MRKKVDKRNRIILLIITILLLTILTLLITFLSSENANNDYSTINHGNTIPGDNAIIDGNVVNKDNEVNSDNPITSDNVIDGDNLITGNNAIDTEKIVTSPQGEVKEFKITARKYSFEPEIIEVNKGDKVRLIIKSADVAHSIVIPEYGINERIDVGKTVTVEFIVDTVGSFSSFCSVYCGSGHDEMKGEIIVR